MNSTNQQLSDDIRQHRAELAAVVVDRQFSGVADLAQRYARIGREDSLQAVGSHFLFLAQALALGSQALFTDYVAWAKVMLAQRGLLAPDFAVQLNCLADVLEEKLPAGSGVQAAAFVHNAVAAMPAMPEELPIFLKEGEPLTPLAHQYLEALLRGECHLASRLVLDAVAAGTPVRDIYLHVFQPVQWEIGRLWQINRLSVGQEHYCTAATQLVMSLLYPRIFSVQKKGVTLVAACVAGDLHELGVRMVADFFEMDGWSTYYLGANTPHASVIEAVIERRADILAISATMPFNIDAVKNLINAVRQHPACAGVKILVGGYPFNHDLELWRRVGADGSATDAQQAVILGNRIMGEANA